MCTISDTAKVNLESCDFWNSVFVSRSILLSELWRFISFANAQPPSDLLLLTQAMTPACFIIWIALSIACSDATFFSFARALVKTQVKAFLSHLRSRCRMVLDSCGRGCCLMKGISKWREGVDLQYFTVPLSFPAVAYKEMDKIARAAGISFCFCIQKFVTHFQTFSSYCRKASSGALATEARQRRKFVRAAVNRWVVLKSSNQCAGALSSGARPPGFKRCIEFYFGAKSFPFRHYEFPHNSHVIRLDTFSCHCLFQLATSCQSWVSTFARQHSWYVRCIQEFERKKNKCKHWYVWILRARRKAPLSRDRQWIGDSHGRAWRVRH